MTDKYKSLGKNTLLFAISSFGTKFLSFLLVPLYTNVLSTAEYGTADLITSTGTLLIFVLTINIADSVLRFAIERKQNQREILSYGIRVLVIGSLWCALGLGICCALALFNWPVHYYFLLLLYFFATALYQVLSNYLRGIGKVTQVAVAGIVSSAVIIASNIFFLLVLKCGIVGYVVSLILGPFLAALYCGAMIHEPLTVYVQNICDSATMAQMRAYCIPLVFNNVALWMNAFLDRYFIVWFCGIGENGIYSVANKIPTILATCYTVFSQAWNLSAIKEFDPEDKDGFFSNTYSMYNTFITIACSGLILFNIPLAKMLYAKDFFQAWQYSSVLLLSIMFNSLTIFVGSLFSAVKKTKTIAATTVLSAIINTGLNAIFIPIWGALGAAIATTAAYAVMWFARYIIIRKYINLRISLLKDILVYILLSVQIVFEHQQGHGYLGQITIGAIVLFIYRKNILSILKQVLLRKKG